MRLEPMLVVAVVRCDAYGTALVTIASVPVILLHGLNRGARSMSSLQRALQGEGRTVVNLDYPSAKLSVPELALWLRDVLVERGIASADRAIDNPGADFVTHSLGGIVLRAMHAQFPQIVIRRAAMLSPPNQGSEVVDKLGHWLPTRALFRAIAGPAGRQLGTAADSAPNRLGAVGFETGVVAGNVSLNPFYSWLIPGQDDGTVAVRRMRVAGMSDFITVGASHTFIMHNAQAIHQACHFLAHGCFDHAR